MPIGLILTLFTTLLIILIFLFNNKTKKIFSNYWFYSISSSIFLLIFIAFRWSFDLKSWIENDDRQLIGGLQVIKSKVLLLDLCPFNYVFLCLFCIFDKKRFYASAISVISLIGGAVTIYGQIAFEAIGKINSNIFTVVDPNMKWWEYTFANQLYFIMHFYLTIFGLIILMNTSGFDLKKIIVNHLYIVLFFIYIIIISFSMNIKWNVTGISENDWGPTGEYGVIGKFLSFLSWPWQPIIVFLFIWIITMTIIQIRNIMILDFRYYENIKLFVCKQLRDSYINFLYKKI